MLVVISNQVNRNIKLATSMTNYFYLIQNIIFKYLKKCFKLERYQKKKIESTFVLLNNVFDEYLMCKFLYIVFILVMCRPNETDCFFFLKNCLFSMKTTYYFIEPSILCARYFLIKICNSCSVHFISAEST